MLLVDVDGDTVVSRVHSLPAPENNTINQLNLVEGRLPEKSGECVIEASDTKEQSTYTVGTKLVVDKANEDLDTKLSTTEYTVVGIVHNANYFSFEREPASVGNGTVKLVFYIPQQDFAYEAYTEAYLTAAGALEQDSLGDVYQTNIDTVKAKMDQAKASGCFAVAMDVDAAGLPFLKNMTPPAGSKSVAELAEIVKLAERPFIVKGVMTVKGALKAKEAGAAAIVVSNHGGRVLDQCPATAEVLPEIAEALKGSGVKILVDGGIRTGVDVFKALALGADAVLICRPFVTAVYGGGEEGVKCYIDKIAVELADTMQMCGAHSLAEITRDMVRI